MDPNRQLYINAGLGQESTAIIVMYVMGLLPRWMYNLRAHVVFADTGAEMPFTYAWARRYLEPWLRARGHRLHWLAPGGPYHRTRPTKHYPQGRILQDIRTTYLSDRYPSFPMLNSGGRCTETHKQNVLARFRAAQGLAWHGRTPYQQTRAGCRDVVLVGIAADETHRALPSPAKNYEILYPLISAGLDRKGCVELIRRYGDGLPVPGKSGCSMCPFAPAWSHWWLSVRHPREFQKNVQLEAAHVRDRLARGLNPNYMLHRYQAPLPEAVRMWREQNPGITVEEVERWFYDREAYRVEWGKRRAATPCYDCTAA